MSGAFSRDFAEKKKWKTDEGLMRVLRYLCDEKLPEHGRVIDIGAGVGKYVQWFRDQGHEAQGYDAIEGIEDLSAGLVEELDITQVAINNRFPNIDLAICIEVLEHIPPDRLESAFDTLRHLEADCLLFSMATPGQRGRDHVSCRLPEYAAIELTSGVMSPWELMHDETVKLRELAGKGWSHKLLFFG
jgi:hypothetical protein